MIRKTTAGEKKEERNQTKPTKLAIGDKWKKTSIIHNSRS